MRVLVALLVLCSACGLPSWHLGPRPYLHSPPKRPVELAEVTVDVAFAPPLVILTATRQDRCSYEAVSADARPARRKLSVPCPSPAAATLLRMELSTGTLDVTTDERGKAYVLLPAEDMKDAVSIRASVADDELRLGSPVVRPATLAPRSGPVVATTPVAPTVGSVDKPRTGMAIVRDALLDCGTKHGVRGLVRSELTLAAHAEIRKVETHQSPEFQACVDGALRGKRIPISRPPGQLEFPYFIK